MDRSRPESDPFDLPETMRDTIPDVPLFDSDEVGYVNENDEDAPVEEEPRG